FPQRLGIRSLRDDPGVSSDPAQTGPVPPGRPYRRLCWPAALSRLCLTSYKGSTQRLCDPQRALEHYLIWHEAEGHSRKTELVYHKTLRPFFAYLKDEQQVEDLGDLTLEHLRAWLVWLRNTPGPHDRPRSSKTIETYCRQVKAFLHWLSVEELLEHNPAE